MMVEKSYDTSGKGDPTSIKKHRHIITGVEKKKTEVATHSVSPM